MSLVITAYNAECVIERCIQSMADQKYKNIECIIVENGSIDKTLDVCTALSKKYTYVKVFSNKTAGASAARNFGLSKVIEKLIM